MTYSPLIRFWSKVALTADPERCWDWVGKGGSKGYGAFYFGGRVWRAHRLSWEFANGSIPLGMNVLHRCDRPCCVNPRHLFVGTQKDNMLDCSQKGRLNRVTGAAHWMRTTRNTFQGEGHPRAALTEADVAEIRLKKETINQQAARYGVSRWAIEAVRYGRNWKTLTKYDI